LLLAAWAALCPQIRDDPRSSAVKFALSWSGLSVQISGKNFRLFLKIHPANVAQCQLQVILQYRRLFCTPACNPPPPALIAPRAALHKFVPAPLVVVYRVTKAQLRQFY
jgi:hypothetical protein